MKIKKYRSRLSSPGPDSGFTMIELSIAGLILAIVISGVLLTYRTATNAYRKVEVRLELSQNVLAAMGTMAQDLRGAYKDLKGDRKVVSLQTTYPEGDTPGLTNEKYYLDDKGLHRQIGDGDSILAPWAETLEFSYSDGSDWYDTWDKQPGRDLPAAVRIKMVLKSPPGKFQQETSVDSTIPVMAGRK